MDDFVRAASLSNYLEVADQLGLDGPAMLRETGIDRRALANPDSKVKAEAVCLLLEHSAQRSGCETFGLRMAESRTLSDFGAISLLLMHQPTVREALMTVIQHRRLLNPSLIIDVEEDKDLVIIREKLTVGPQTPTRQAYELAIGVLFRMFRSLLGGRWRALSVNFCHPAPAETVVHRRVFGPICEFDCDFDGFTCSRDDLDAANPSADQTLAGHAERYVQSLPQTGGRTLAEDVQKSIYLLLPGGHASIVAVAESLSMNERTLQRRLRGEDADFSALLDKVRVELASRYLANTGFPLGRLPDLLGYSRQSSFNRWFV